MEKNNFIIEYSDINCLDFLKTYDRHMKSDMIPIKIQNKEVIVVKEMGKIFGWLRFGYFWDNIPFMNMLFIFEEYRMNGIGKAMVDFWEKEMYKKGFDLVLTSTLSNEHAQHFYRKLGYKDSGCLLLDSEPSLEIILSKKLEKNL